MIDCSFEDEGEKLIWEGVDADMMCEGEIPCLNHVKYVEDGFNGWLEDVSK